jgi:uncharacterized LabA/DUF88 family protein
MAIPRTFVFADGENLVMRYQAMLAAGATPKKGVIHVSDVFVWAPGLTTWSCMDIQRVTYYTSASGDQVLLKELRSKIAGTTYKYAYDPDTTVPDGQAQLVPRIYHKDSRSRKTRNVDINIVIDVMRASHLNNVDLLVLLSGDGDYIPMVEEAMRLGKAVWVAAFSSGLNEALSCSVDLFETLDDIFFTRPTSAKS